MLNKYYKQYGILKSLVVNEALRAYFAKNDKHKNEIPD